MLPFSRAQFLAVFAQYNLGVWPAQAIAYALGFAMVILMLRPSPNAASRAIGFGLAVMWCWTGFVYHWLYFSAINPAALIFGALFLLQGALIAHATGHDSLRFGATGGATAWAGWTLVAYAALVYPMTGMSAGHRYPELPMFGITPCPVALFTLGLLLLTTSPVPRTLLVIPLVWSLIGGSAAILLDMPQDWPLLLSALVIVPLLFVDRRRQTTVAQR